MARKTSAISLHSVPAIRSQKVFGCACPGHERDEAVLMNSTVEKENSLHVPSTPRLSHSDSNYSHSRTASVDDDLSGSQAGLDPVTQVCR